jgi:hypothetical protein
MTGDQYGDFLKAKLNVQDLRSRVELDTNTSMFKATFYSDEIEDLQSYFTDSNGDIVFRVRIGAFVPNSA